MLATLRPGRAGLPCLLAAFAQQQRGRKTLAGGPEEEAKRERRRQRRQTTLRLKEWVATQEPMWFVGTAASQHKPSGWRQDPGCDEDEEADTRFWEQLLKGARSRKEHQRLRRAWKQWQKASGRQQEQDQSSGFGPGFGSFWEQQQEIWRARQRASSSYSWQDMWGDATGGPGSSGAWHRWQAGSFGEQQQQQRCRQQPSTVGSSAVQSSMAALGLCEGTALSAQLLKDAFRRSALRWHPDRHPADGRPQAELCFKEAQAAFQLLLSMVAP